MDFKDFILRAFAFVCLFACVKPKQQLFFKDIKTQTNLLAFQVKVTHIFGSLRNRGIKDFYFFPHLKRVSSKGILPSI